MTGPQRERLFEVEDLAIHPSIRLRAIHAHSEEVGRRNAATGEREKSEYMVKLAARTADRERQMQQTANLITHFALSQDLEPEE